MNCSRAYAKRLGDCNLPNLCDQFRQLNLIHNKDSLARRRDINRR